MAFGLSPARNATRDACAFRVGNFERAPFWLRLSVKTPTTSATWELKMPVFMKYDEVDGKFSHADTFDFLQQTTEPTALEVARTNKPSLVVKFDIGGGPGSALNVHDDGLLLPAVQDDGLLLPAVQTDYGLLLPY
jgi:hypothetical protein